MFFSRPASIVFASILCMTKTFGLPTLDETKSLTVNGQSIDVVPDDVDTARFYFFPSTINIETKNNAPQFSFYHHGITKADLEGAGATVNITVKPDWVHSFIDSVIAELKKSNPNASLSVIPIEKSYFDIVISNSFVSAKTPAPQPAILLDDFTIKYLT